MVLHAHMAENAFPSQSDEIIYPNVTVFSINSLLQIKHMNSQFGSCPWLWLSQRAEGSEPRQGSLLGPWYLQQR